MAKATGLTLVAVLGLVITATACSTPVSPTRSGLSIEPIKTPSPIPINDEEAIRQLINAEGEAVVKQDIDRLAGIWAIDGIVTDATQNGGKTWKGWESILDRYVNIIFPSNPTFVEHPNIRVTITGENAVAISDTKIGTTDLKKNDLWRLEKMNGQWKITALTFGLSSK